MTPTGLESIGLSLGAMVEWLLAYTGLKHAIVEQSQSKRIRIHYVAGETLSDLVRAFVISPQRCFKLSNKGNLDGE
jgi:hypothetical protein